MKPILWIYGNVVTIFIPLTYFHIEQEFLWRDMDISGTMLIQRENGKLFPYSLFREYVCVHVCVWLPVYVRISSEAHGQYLDVLLYCSSFFILREAFSWNLYFLGLNRLVTKELQGFACICLSSAVFRRVLYHPLLSTQVLKIQIWVSLLAQPALDWISHLLSVFLREF